MKTTQTTPSALYAGLKIKVVGKNEAREGTRRHAMFEVLRKCGTVEKGFATPINTEHGTYYMQACDLVTAVQAGLIEVE